MEQICFIPTQLHVDGIMSCNLFLSIIACIINSQVQLQLIVFVILIPGSLIKLVYFSRHEDRLVNNRRKKSVKEIFGLPTGNRRSYPILGGRLHFVKFETHKMNECLDFIHSKQLHRNGNFFSPSCLPFNN